MTTESQQQDAGAPTMALTTFDEELARQAEEAAKQAAGSGVGDYFSLRGGLLKLNGMQLPDNQMAVVVLDFLWVNAYYEGVYDPDNVQVPSCYAMGRDEKVLAPHAGAEVRQAEACAKCPHNEFGSLTGADGKARRGKECRNTARLCLIPGGSISRNPDGSDQHVPPLSADQILQVPNAFLSAPPTSVKIFRRYVTIMAGRKLPPRALWTKIKLIPDTKSVYKLEFTPLGPVPEALFGAVMVRSQEAGQLIMHPFPARNQGADAPNDAPADGKGAPTPGARRSSGAGGKAAPAGKKRKY